MLLIIIGLAVVVTMMVTNQMTEEKAKLDDQKRILTDQMNAKGKAVYAVKDIPEGTTILAEMVEEKELPEAKIPIDAVRASAMATARVAKAAIAAGQIVSQHDLAVSTITSLGFESRLKAGFRAVTFGVDNNSGVAGFVTPESHVDVVSMVGAGGETKAAPILSDVEVIAVGQTFQKAPSGTAAAPASSVTVAVTPEDAQKLLKAINASKLYLTLRSGTDHTPVATVDVTSLFPKAAAIPKDAITSLPPPQSLPPPPLPGPDAGPMPPGGPMPMMAPPVTVPPPVHEIEIWSGSKKDVLSVPKS
jgi:pilus assembly protein CpaB